MPLGAPTTTFFPTTSFQTRAKYLTYSGLGLLTAFVALRFSNVYGDPTPWSLQDSVLGSVMSFVNVTKYPPSACFLLLTLGVGLLSLLTLESVGGRINSVLKVLGLVPLFFYVVHLYILQALYKTVNYAWFTGAGEKLSVANMTQLWLLAFVICVPMWFMCRWFGNYKKRSTLPFISYL